MKMRKRITALSLALIMLLSLAACGTDTKDTDSGEKILRVAESFAYPSLDAHKEYYGWYTSIYGITEALFKMGDDSSVQPCLAEKAEVSDDGLTWTVTLKDGICFSNGSTVTAAAVIANLKRVGEMQAYVEKTKAERPQPEGVTEEMVVESIVYQCKQMWGAEAFCRQQGIEVGQAEIEQMADQFAEMMQLMGEAVPERGELLEMARGELCLTPLFEHISRLIEQKFGG